MPKLIDEEKVFVATIKIFIARGYEHTTTKDIAAEAGVHEATLYRKYGSKAGLIERALEYRLSDTPLDKVTYTGDLEADLVRIVQAQIETHTTVHNDILSVLLAEVPLHVELKNAMARPLAHIARVANILHEYQMQGLLKEESILATVGVLLGPIIMRGMFERAVPFLPVPPPPDPQEYVDHFLHGKSV